MCGFNERTAPQRVVEVLKQGQYVPLPVEKQIVTIYAGTKGMIDHLETSQLAAWEKGLYDYLEAKYKDIFDDIRAKKVLDKDLEAKLQKAIKEYNTAFGKGDKK